MHIYTTDGILPPDAYFNPLWHAIAKEMVYDNAPEYLGHVTELVEDGSYMLTHDSRGGRYLLVKDGVDIRCFDKRCRHQGAVLIDPAATPEYTSTKLFAPEETLVPDTPKGKRTCLVCPLHQWSYGLDGALKGAPHFDMARLGEERKHLVPIPIRIWNGMIFTCPNGSELPWERDVQSYSHRTLFDLSDHFLGGMSSQGYDASMHIFNKVYFDDRHVLGGHPTSFGAVMDLRSLRFYEGGTFNVQEVGFLMEPRRKLCTEYREWHTRLSILLGNKKPEFGALWSFFYPNLMIEVYPWTTVVSIMDPTGPDTSTNRCFFFYPNELRYLVDFGEMSAKEYQLFIEAQQAAYARTAAEDYSFVMRIAHGLKIAYENGENFRGVPHPVEEAGIFSYDRYFEAVQGEFVKLRP